MVFFGAASYAREKLREAEGVLFKLAARHGNRSPDTYRMEFIDTNIPSSAVPLKGLKVDHLVIHGVRLDALDDHQKLSEYPLVLLHGYMNGALYYYRNLVGLTKFFSTVYSLDFLGWGLSSRPAFTPLNNSVQAAENVFVESLEAWREANKIERMVLAGHSMGGYLSVAYCERYPDRVDRLILISPVGVPVDVNSKTRKLTWGARLASLLFHWDFTPCSVVRSLPEGRGKGFVQRYVEQRLPAIDDPEEQKALTNYLYYNMTSAASGEYAVQRLLSPFAFAKEPTIYRIPNLKVKNISFLYGENDWMDASAGLQVKKRRNDINVYRVPNAGHLLMLENCQDFEKAFCMGAGGRNQEGPMTLSVDADDGVTTANPPPQVLIGE